MAAITTTATKIRQNRQSLMTIATTDMPGRKPLGNDERHANHFSAHVWPPRGVLGAWAGSSWRAQMPIAAPGSPGFVEIEPSDSALEVGFGPGVIIQRLSKLASEGHVAGIDPSQEMIEQARARNAAAIKVGRVDLRLGSVERLPFDDSTFDKALAINSMQVWPDDIAGLAEIRRVMKRGAKATLGFTPHSGQQKQGLTQTLRAAGFANATVSERGDWFCALALKP